MESIGKQNTSDLETYKSGNRDRHRVKVNKYEYQPCLGDGN